MLVIVRADKKIKKSQKKGMTRKFSKIVFFE